MAKREHEYQPLEAKIEAPEDHDFIMTMERIFRCKWCGKIQE